MKAWFERFRAWLFADLYVAEAKWNNAQMAAIQDLAAKVQALTTQIQASHVAQKPFVAPSLDSWEAAQLEAMWRLQQDPDKEH